MNRNKQLVELYEETLNKESLKKVFQEQLTELSSPFLLNVDDSYVSSDKKILFVGKETNKWWGKLKNFVEMDNSIEILRERYKAELFGGNVQSQPKKQKG